MHPNKNRKPATITFEGRWLQALLTLNKNNERGLNDKV